MDILSLATWVVAGLAVTVLLLCSILAIILIVTWCRRQEAERRRGGQKDGSFCHQDASFCPAEDISSTPLLQTTNYTGNTTRNQPEVDQQAAMETGGHLVDNVAQIKNGHAGNWGPTINKTNVHPSSVERINERTQLQTKIPFGKTSGLGSRRTRSSLDISQKSRCSMCGTLSSDHQASTTRFPQLLPTLLESTEAPSIYFDAEELDESRNKDDIDEDRESQYEDVLELSDNNEPIDDNDAISDNVDNDSGTDSSSPLPSGRQKARKRCRRRTLSSEVSGKSPTAVRSKAVEKRLEALKRLYQQQKEVDFQFYRDLHLLEVEFGRQHVDILYAKRQEIIDGAPSSHDSGVESCDMAGTLCDCARLTTRNTDGIPGFWLRVLLNSSNISPMVQSSDVPILGYLRDIRLEYLDREELGFRLKFHFKPNEYFTNTELIKDYFVRYQPAEGEDHLHFDGLEISGCLGCKIYWKRRMNVTVRPVKKVRDNKLVTRWTRKNSFFNFFHPPRLDDQDDRQLIDKKRALLTAHFQMGLFFKEQLIPRAYLYFTRPGYDAQFSKTKAVGMLHKYRSQGEARQQPLSQRLSLDSQGNG